MNIQAPCYTSAVPGPTFTTAVLLCCNVFRQLELRRQLDVDGWTADVTTLRKTLAAVDRKLLQMRLIDR